MDKTNETELVIVNVELSKNNMIPQETNKSKPIKCIIPVNSMFRMDNQNKINSELDKFIPNYYALTTVPLEYIIPDMTVVKHNDITCVIVDSWKDQQTLSKEVKLNDSISLVISKGTKINLNGIIVILDSDILAIFDRHLIVEFEPETMLQLINSDIQLILNKQTKMTLLESNTNDINGLSDDQKKYLKKLLIDMDDLQNAFKNDQQKFLVENNLAIRYLHQNGLDLRFNEDWLFGWAAEYGKLEIVKYLVEHGIDINEKTKHGSSRGYALRWSYKKGHRNVVEYLLSKGANVREAFYDDTQTLDKFLKEFKSEIKN
jgi:hypothetical protein